MTAVILVDLDGFKDVNDTYGHAAGDELLRTAAERLNANVRANDTVSRLGGDEFVVLLPRLVDDQIADAVAHRILRDLAQPLIIGDTVLTIPASAGIAVTRGSGTAVDDVMREADLALYQAKAEGKGVARRFDPAQFAAAEQRRRDEAELRRALGPTASSRCTTSRSSTSTASTPSASRRWSAGGTRSADCCRRPRSSTWPRTLGMLPQLGGWVLERGLPAGGDLAAARRPASS